MIDFTSCEINQFKAYGGANGQKIHIRYEGKGYMLKFPPVPKRSKTMSYSNGCISEYLACHIYESMGFKTQETILGTYTDKRGKTKTVVACADFTEDGKRLIEFAELKNTCINSEQNGFGTEVSSIMEAIEEQTLLPAVKTRQFFWDMFIADAFLGNFDRHNGNWGILVDEKNRTAEVAPIYDCGSCLYPQMDVNDMAEIMKNQDEINQRIFVYPTSAIEEEGKKISYFDYISSLKNVECNDALKRITGKIDMERIGKMVEATPELTEIQKEFYLRMLQERKEKILDYSLKLLLVNEQAQAEQNAPKMSM